MNDLEAVMPTIDTDSYSSTLRTRLIKPDEGRILISRIDGSSQAEDLTDPPNCLGFGRVRHFRLATKPPWPPNPLPIAPASAALGRPRASLMKAQVFQNAGCNWRCWYCFVPFDLLSGNEKRSGWLTAGDMVEMYLAEPDKPLVIDCSGGQPDLVPEWIPWMMAALQRAGRHRDVYLWSDDNLSNDYFWRYLSPADRTLVRDYPMYGRVCCFKGFDPQSFSFNTRADPELFDRQFRIFSRLLREGLDLYAYATFTAAEDDHLDRRIKDFVDQLQEIHENLPLRLVPLRIEEFGVVTPRVRDIHRTSMVIQEEAVQLWLSELSARFDEDQIQAPIHQVPLT
jgi:uncharacterized Fe-S cluster-containing radical SAM superfamily protein